VIGASKISVIIRLGAKRGKGELAEEPSNRRDSTARWNRSKAFRRGELLSVLGEQLKSTVRRKLKTDRASHTSN